MSPTEKSRRAEALLWGLAGGLAAWAAFPPLAQPMCGWLAPALWGIPAAAAGRAGDRPRLSWRGGLVGAGTGGLLYHLATIHWLRHTTWPGFLLLSLYLTLYPVLYWAGMRLLAGAFPLARGVASRVAIAVCGASLWVALEWMRAHALSGFPWNLLGVSQVDSLLLLQIAEWTGVYGVSWVVAAVSLLVGVTAWRIACERHVPRTRPFLEFYVAMLVLVAVLLIGLGSVRRWRPGSGWQEGTPLRVAIVQGAVPQEVKQRHTDDEGVRDRYLRLSGLAAAAGAEFIIWPETAAPLPLLEDPVTLVALQRLAMDHGVSLLIGTIDSEPAPDRAEWNQYNAAYLVEADGRVEQRYRKVHLVPFGEFIPFEETLPWMARMIPVPGSLAWGHRRELLRLPGEGGLEFAVLICFEDTLPHHVRRYVRPGLGLLVNITNDGWFKRTSASRQHAAAARLRAVETRLPMVRSANTGVSCLIDRTGRLVHVFTDGGIDGTFAEGTATWELIPSRLDAAGLTFYARHGDRFAAACTLVALLGLGLGLGRRARRMRANDGSQGRLAGAG